jgi:hypothetical protein
MPETGHRMASKNATVATNIKMDTDSQAFYNSSMLNLSELNLNNSTLQNLMQLNGI